MNLQVLSMGVTVQKGDTENTFPMIPLTGFLNYDLFLSFTIAVIFRKWALYTNDKTGEKTFYFIQNSIAWILRYDR